jgi:deoxyribodipyrimidine photo-lyase
VDPAPAIVWFERDLRLADNRALAEAAGPGRPILPVFVLDEEDAGRWRLGGASRWWLHRSLAALAADLRRLGLPLILRRGRAEEIIPALAEEVAADIVVWNRRYEPWHRARERRLRAALRQSGISGRSYNGSLLFEPARVRTREGRPYQVFGAFWRALRALGSPSAPLPLRRPLRPPAHLPESEKLSRWHLRPSRLTWSEGLRGTWLPGERGARIRLLDFLDTGLPGYAAERDRPDRDGTSQLSPHLHFGEISARTVWLAVAQAAALHPGLEADCEAYLRQLAWREFSCHLLFGNERLADEPLRPEFSNFPWHAAPAELQAWQRGKTGYPIVDAGMRQLWRTGWMHNRVRMITASFLVKDLLQPWQEGEAWFWDTLVDADLANNAAGWQWVAGCGVDAQPFARVFNPILQGERFDPRGDYVRQFVPELAGLPAEHIHRPWLAPGEVLDRAGVTLGADYPLPIVDHARARRRALDALRTMRRPPSGVGDDCPGGRPDAIL